ncbi:unnamed protein product [Dicrocoelium dendriticum]|nr:unnamed protein product [Dicrocoelium dendriticum]
MKARYRSTQPTQIPVVIFLRWNVNAIRSTGHKFFCRLQIALYQQDTGDWPPTFHRLTGRPHGQATLIPDEAEKTAKIGRLRRITSGACAVLIPASLGDLMST